MRDTEKHIYDRNRYGKRYSSDDGLGGEHLSSNGTRFTEIWEEKPLCGPHDLLGRVLWCGCIFMVGRGEKQLRKKIKDVCERGGN